MRRLACIVCLLSAVMAGPASGADLGAITGPLVVSDAWPQCTDLKSWMRDVMRLAGVENASETDRGKAFFEWLRLFNRMATGGMIQAHEGAYGQESYVLDAHKNLFVYGWGYCDTHSRIAEAAWREYTGDPTSAERVITMHEDGTYHTMYRLRLDGRYAAFDARYGYYLIDRDAPDARLLDWIEVGEDANILRNRSYRYRSRPFFEFFGREWERALLINRCWYDTEESWEKAGRPVECVFGNGQYRMGTRYHDMNFRLLKGTRIERFWDNSARLFYVPANPRAQREEPFLPSGRFYRVTETMFNGNWPKYDPNYQRAKPYLATVPTDEGYNAQVAGGRTIGQAWGRIIYEPDVEEAGLARVDGEAVVDLYSPYVLVEGTLEGELAGDAKIEIRTLEAKPRNADQPDVWSGWQALAEEPGVFHVPLGRARFNGADAGIHGVYRFQLRIKPGPRSRRESPAGLKAIKLVAYFETGIMSIPQIFAGSNTIRFKVRDAKAVRGPIRVTYRYQTAGGERKHEKVLRPSDFRGNEAVYQIDAPGLMRCKSLAIAY